VTWRALRGDGRRPGASYNTRKAGSVPLSGVASVTYVYLWPSVRVEFMTASSSSTLAILMGDKMIKGADNFTPPEFLSAIERDKRNLCGRASQ